jgi:hypothetical protein
MQQLIMTLTGLSFSLQRPQVDNKLEMAIIEIQIPKSEKMQIRLGKKFVLFCDDSPCSLTQRYHFRRKKKELFLPKP